MLVNGENQLHPAIENFIAMLEPAREHLSAALLQTDRLDLVDKFCAVLSVASDRDLRSELEAAQSRIEKLESINKTWERKAGQRLAKEDERRQQPVVSRGVWRKVSGREILDMPPPETRKKKIGRPPTPVPEEVIRNLYAEGLTQTEIAARTGISQSIVNRYNPNKRTYRPREHRAP
jgi:predicted DNA-binding protein (UPF0251 family)